MNHFRALFCKNSTATTAGRCRVIGMVHVGPLPGTPLYQGNFETLLAKATQEAEVYLDAGIDSLLVENMHDVPYVPAKTFGPETVASMTRVCCEIKRLCADRIPLGLQILACGNREALAVAKAAQFNYIRAEGFVFGHVADEGYTDANAGALLRYRKYIDAENVLIFSDIKKKHSSHAITSDVSLVETAKAAEFFLTDGIILTGTATGSPASPTELIELKTHCQAPILIGSGVTVANFQDYANADGCIIGSHFKVDGKWQNSVDAHRVREFMNVVNNIQNIKHCRT